MKAKNELDKLANLAITARLYHTVSAVVSLLGEMQRVIEEDMTRVVQIINEADKDKQAKTPKRKKPTPSGSRP